MSVVTLARRSGLLALLLLVVAAGSASRAALPISSPTAASLAEAVTTLAAPDMEGRASGTPGGERAARRIARWLTDAGLRPGGDAGTFFQSFAIANGTVVAPDSRFDLLAPGPQGRDPGQTHFALERDWRPHGGSVATSVSGEVVFVGYGIVTADGTHDDYTGVDVNDRIALALAGAPRGATATGASRLEKLIAARRHGAAAVLLVNDTLPSVASTATAAGMVSASVTPRAADALLAPSGATTATLERAIARGTTSAFATGTRARITVALGKQERRAENVVGVLPGTDPALASEAVVVGAHWDHLGVVDGAIHPGADDNASGTAVVVGLAKSFAAAGGAPRTLVFTLFAGEELGLLGSRHYVGDPAVPMTRTVAMVNLDMVGRMRDRQLEIGGVDSGTGLREIVSDAVRTADLKSTLRGAPYAPSDHVRFYRSGTPVLFFHTGSHDDYHKPSDTADRINADGMARVATVAAEVIERLAAGSRPSYVAMPPERRERTSGGGGGGAFLGIVADQGAGDGVRVADVMPSSAAERGGLREGDVLVRLAGASLVSFDDLRTALKARNPGDRVELQVLRNGDDRTVSITLGARS